MAPVTQELGMSNLPSPPSSGAATPNIVRRKEGEGRLRRGRKEKEGGGRRRKEKEGEGRLRRRNNYEQKLLTPLMFVAGWPAHREHHVPGLRLAGRRVRAEHSSEVRRAEYCNILDIIKIYYNTLKFKTLRQHTTASNSTAIYYSIHFYCTIQQSVAAQPSYLIETYPRGRQICPSKIG